MANFVDVVGYQLEKVHTGVMKWILDTSNSDFSHKEKEKVFWALAGKSASKPPSIGKIIPIQEYSFGRSHRIDLVLQGTAVDGKRYDIVIEVKVDGDVDRGQLEETRKKYDANKDPNTQAFYLIVALGAGQYTIEHQNNTISSLGYRALNLKDIIRVFSGLSPKNGGYLYKEWIEALNQEAARDKNIIANLSGVSSFYQLEQFGYRRGNSMFYTFYDHLRKWFKNKQLYLSSRGVLLGNMGIWNGGNNAVLSLGLKKNKGTHTYYWEFNDQEFCLKADVEDKNNFTNGAFVTDKVRVRGICDRFTASIITDKKSGQDRPGQWVTIYKWYFDFAKHSLQDIVDQTAEIIEAIHPQL